jgi:glycosyltransferase involved in cell wall biosynthesis
LKILHVIASADPRSGGPIEGILRQEDAMAGRASGVLVTLDAPDAPFLRDISMPVHALGRLGSSTEVRPWPFKYGFSITYIMWLIRNAGRFDAVIVHGLWNFSTLAASITLPFLRSAPYFVYPHGMMDPWFGQHDPLKYFFKKLSWIFCEGRLLHGAKSVLFTAEDERDLARDQFPIWRYAEAVVGYGTASPPPSTAAQAEAFRAAVPELGQKRYLLFLSRIHPKKGCDLLVEAFAQAAALDPDLDLVIAGPDETGIVPSLRVRAEDLGIGRRIHWPGMLRGDAKWGAYFGAEAFILPSHQENFGVVVAEALGCGLPVLTTNKVNIWKAIVEDKVGFVGGDTLEGVRGIIANWTSSNLEDRARMKARSKISFSERFDVKYSVDRLLNKIGFVSVT